MNKLNINIFVVSLMMGIFIIIQGRSFENVGDIILRDSQKNFYEEIRVLNESNKDLDSEVKDLNASLEDLKDRNKALDVIEGEISKYRKLSGDGSVFGPGIVITINGKMDTAWIVDLINDLFSAGSEAVSVNGVRITNFTAGFDTLPQGQNMVNSKIISQPFVFKALGDSKTISGILESAGSYFDRFEGSFPGVAVITEEREVIHIN